MSGMFSRCNSLTSLDLSNFSAQNVNNNMQYMFFDCNSLISLDLSNFNTQKLYSKIFLGCNSLIKKYLNK